MKDTVAKTPRKAGTAGTGVIKKVASALAKKIAGVLSPPAKTPAARAKVAARPATGAAAPKPEERKPAKGAVKGAAKAAAARKTAQPAVKAGAPAAAVKTAPARATVKAAAVKPATVKAAGKTPGKAAAAPKRTAQRAATPAVPEAVAVCTKKTVAQAPVQVGETGARTAAGGVTAELADKMKTSVVSKVSEVMTKTTKSTPAANTEGRILSEDEIRSMNDKDYMNADQLAFFKARLQQLEKDLLKNAGETTEHLRETVLVPDPADRATIEEEHALELRTRDRERKLLKKVQQSIAAIDAGDYGWCEETGEPIGIPRLIARPTATLSLEAQQRRELKQKLYGD
ncbi:RNA polymerase-binding protein DksA [Massilia sp. PAMC28688]|uniref:RNA polymerase-binding protein DksA n=1 Tax=Massilia sp. PAMC28688 TaxID=2861283 RepID=UPI001E31671C|nr:RNA polymerase-binding protein DksA [Massilia sp. PAMC28688]